MNFRIIKHRATHTTEHDHINVGMELELYFISVDVTGEKGEQLSSIGQWCYRRPFSFPPHFTILQLGFVPNTRRRIAFRNFFRNMHSRDGICQLRTGTGTLRTQASPEATGRRQTAYGLSGHFRCKDQLASEARISLLMPRCPAV